MRFQELNEAAQSVFDLQPATAKLEQIKKFLTPEVMAKHANVIIHLLAVKVDSRTLDELQAKIEGEESPDDIKFNKDLMLKALPKETAPRYNDSGDIYGTFRKDEKEFKYVKDGQNYIFRRSDVSYFIYFSKARWEVLIRVGWPSSNSRKRFEKAEDVVAFINKRLAVTKKEDAEFEKFKADHKATERT